MPKSGRSAIAATAGAGPWCRFAAPYRDHMQALDNHHCQCRAFCPILQGQPVCFFLFSSHGPAFTTCRRRPPTSLAPRPIIAHLPYSSGGVSHILLGCPPADFLSFARRLVTLALSPLFRASSQESTPTACRACLAVQFWTHPLFPGSPIGCAQVPNQ